MQIINGGEIAQNILSKLRSEVKRLFFTPLLVDVLVGDDPVAASYVKIKAKRAEEIGLKFELIQLPSDATTEQVIAELKKIQTEPLLAGLIIQLPLPNAIDKSLVLNSIDPRVDVDCLGEENTKLFYAGAMKMQPPTAAAVLAILDTFKFDIKAMKFLVIGQGELVGKPLTALLKSRGFDVSVADATTTNLSELTLSADIIIAGAGHPKLINADMIKSDAVLIDCGTSESAGSIVGDIDSESVSVKAKLLAPVPGGVGPITVAKLLQNTVNVAKDLE